MLMTRKLTLVATLALLTAATSACSKSEPEPAAVENEEMTAPEETPTPTSEPTETPSPSAVNTSSADMNASAEIPADVAPAPDEQMMDDASATGMTARASREEQSAGNTEAAGEIEAK
jgi:glucose/arabinose dehydrogenase